jgi:chorismate mutase/prephenate dehydratase
MTSPKDKVYFLGPDGSYSSIATRTLFEDLGQLQPCSNFEEIFLYLSQDHHGWAVLPLENNTAGAVDPAIDLLIASTDVSICAEYHMDVSHTLISSQSEIKEIKVLYSMPQPYYQSYNFIQKHIKDADWIQCPSSSQAIEQCIEHGKGSAAIGALTTAQSKKLNILAENIQDRKDNRTRFVVLSKGKPYDGKLNLSKGLIRTSLVFTLEDQPGTLLDVLNIFKSADINMSHIESRPSKDPRWNYNFLVTLQIQTGQDHSDDHSSINSSALKNALDAVQQSTPWSRHIGTYPLLYQA